MSNPQLGQVPFPMPEACGPRDFAGFRLGEARTGTSRFALLGNQSET